MLKKLEQGMGRLIRSKTDYGLITIFDSRITPGSGPYQFIEKLGYRITSDLEEVINFMTTAKLKINLRSIEQFDENKLRVPKILLNKKTKAKSNIIVQRYQNLESKQSQKLVPKPIKNTGMIPHRLNRPYTIVELQEWLVNFINSHGEDRVNGTEIAKYKKIKTPRSVYENAVELCTDNKLDYHLVEKEFPFKDPYQRQNFRLITPKGSGAFKPDWFS